jgi:GntR family transcriptional regulator, negative regulator for fad regulon and positive regulator of fabA
MEGWIMNDWSPPQRPSEYVEQILVTSILDGTFPAGTKLPAERVLAEQLGITRPTLREVLKHLACDGWLTIHQGRPTQVNDFWHDGGLNMLSTLVRFAQKLPADFVPNLLEVRLALAPAYTRAALTRNPLRVGTYLEDYLRLEEEPQAFASFDWHLHRILTIASGNPIFTLILNGFSSFYEQMAYRYFLHPKSRDSSRIFYRDLYQAVLLRDPDTAEEITREVMRLSLELWKSIST